MRRVTGAAPVSPVTDENSFADVFEAHYVRAVRLAYLHCGDRHRAEDAVAEAMAKVYVRWRQGKIHDVGRYLRQAVVNQVRQGARRRAVADRAIHRRRGDLRGVRTVDDDIAARDEMMRALQQLPDGQRLAVVLRYYEQLSVAETAEVMGIGTGGVKSQTSRGLAGLRELLGVGEDGP